MTGPTLVGHLETVPITDDRARGPFRLPVQWVNRPHLDFRGFSGQIVGGTVRPGDKIRVLPSGRESTIALNADLGFTDADRVENIRRAVEVARLLADAGLIVLASFIAPFRAERTRARERIGGAGHSSKCTSTPRWKWSRRGTGKVCTPRHAAVN